MELFRFLTAGSVDDGKSTLIGHLLHLLDAIKKDQFDQIKTLGKSSQPINYALFTDGLRSERELGITIDVSYKYFSSAVRRFIIADCPGHIEYTRNMFTGASTADLLVLMVNVENGITEQTRRHLKIGQLLDIPNIVVCINKMDLVNYSQEDFSELKLAVQELTDHERANHFYIPVSATKGDNLVTHSEEMSWYTDETLLEVLNSAQKRVAKHTEACFPIQYVIQHNNELQGLGNAFEGGFKVGEEVRLLPQNVVSRISSIQQFDQSIAELSNGGYGSLLVDSRVEIDRGDIIIKANHSYNSAKKLNAKLCWMDEKPLDMGAEYMLKCATQEAYCQIQPIKDENNSDNSIELNSIFSGELLLNKEIVFNSYLENRILGAFVLIDPKTNQTIAGGVVL